MFSKTEFNIPSDLKMIPKPIVGYMGTLTSDRLDINMIEYIAKDLKHFSFVLVGPEDNNFQNSQLHNLSNVYFLGSFFIGHFTFLMLNFF